jgi:hypothetical protein
MMSSEADSMDCCLILLSAMVLTSLHFLFFHYRIIGDYEHRGTGLKDAVMQFWKKRRNKLIHDYSLVGYILSPNPTATVAEWLDRRFKYLKSGVGALQNATTRVGASRQSR